VTFFDILDSVLEGNLGQTGNLELRSGFTQNIKLINPGENELWNIFKLY
jgi:hypothetical protein